MQQYTHPQHGHVRMPFQSHHGQHPIYNYCKSFSAVGWQMLQFVSLSAAYHHPVMTTAGQAPQQVMATSQNAQPPRGQPMPSQCPVSGAMMPPMSVLIGQCWLLFVEREITCSRMMTYHKVELFYAIILPSSVESHH